MAIGTTAAIIGSVSAAASIGQTISGISGTSKAKRDLKNFERQELANVYEDMPISLLGSNLAIEENSRANASYIDAARGGGIRGILGALPAIQSGTNTANRQAQLDLDNQVQRREYAIAGDEQRIQGIQEQRDNEELAGIGQRIDANRQDTWSGIRGINTAFQYDQANKQDKADSLSTVDGERSSIFKRIAQEPINLNPVSELQPVSTISNLTGSFMPSYMSRLPETDYQKQLKTQDQRRMLDEVAPKHW